MDTIQFIVLRIIKSHVGEENAIKDLDIRKLVEVPDPDTKKRTAGLRRIINELRCNGAPICSSVNGYWYAKDIQDLQNNIEQLGGRAVKILEATAGMKKCLEVWAKNGQGKLL